MKSLFTFCAISCFIGVFRLPIEYYIFLRIIVFFGALSVIYNFSSSKSYYFSIIFLVILILFNPVFPIYLYKKSLWIPIDVITGILFLLVAFIEKKQEKPEEENTEQNPESKSSPKAYPRDTIINPKKSK